ncbi:MAG: KEOPS complex subunit Pcc1 [Candidatus Altiarchaeota archaeon]
MNQLKIAIELPQSKAEVVAESIQVETAQKQKRSIIELKADNGLLKLEAETEDLHSLRAVINTYLRYISTSLKLVE